MNKLSRRDFFRKSAKKVLPMMAIALFSSQNVVKASSISDCQSSCSGGCSGDCAGECKGGCKGSCGTGCGGGCGGNCKNDCTGSNAQC